MSDNDDLAQLAYAISVIERTKKLKGNNWTPEDETLLQLAREKLERLQREKQDE